jgi:hypothetical protein
MTRRITAAAIAAIAAVAIASVATAASDNSATVYKASLKPVNPAATNAGLADVAGKAQLVDGKRNKASLHMRNLAADTLYLWHVHSGSCPPAVTGPPVPGWTYRTQTDGNGTLTSNDAGNGNTKGTSADFDAAPGTSYSVNVHLSNGTIIACGDLVASKASGKSKAKSKAKKPHPSQARGPKP